jgi:large subunit ribosomal protein L25
METTNLKILIRHDLKKGANNLLRKNGYILGNISIKGNASIPIAVKKDEFRKALHKYGRNSVFSLESEEKMTYTVMVKDIQILNGDYYHTEFQHVSFNEEIKTDILIRLTGIDILESKRFVIDRQMETIPVIGLPQNIPDTIDFNVSDLKAGDSILASDIKLPEGIRLGIASGHQVFSVNESRGLDLPEEETNIETIDK